MDLEPIMQIERQEEVEVRQLDRLKQLPLSVSCQWKQQNDVC